MGADVMTLKKGSEDAVALTLYKGLKGTRLFAAWVSMACPEL